MKFFAKLKDKIHNSKSFKYVTSALCVGSITVFSALSCFAAEAGEAQSPDMSATLQLSFTSLLGDITKYLGVCLPFALTIFGTFFGIKWAINFFKGVASSK